MEELPENLKGKKNFYINKEGEVIQKVTIHLPRDLVDKLKREALDKRTTLSEIIRRKLKGNKSLEEQEDQQIKTCYSCLNFADEIWEGSRLIARKRCLLTGTLVEINTVCAWWATK